MTAARKEVSAQESQRAAAARSPYELLRQQAARFAGNDLIVLPEAVRALWSQKASTWTYGDVLAQADGLAARYAAVGIAAGHRVALLLENRPAHFLHWLALNALGASVIPVNPDYTGEELAYLLDHGEAAMLVALESRLSFATSVAAGVGVPVASADGDLPAPRNAPQPVDDAIEDRECALVYTSGTTGRPKGCILSNGYFLGWHEWYGAQDGMIALREGTERLMTPLPTFHVNAMGNSFMGMLGSGGAQIIVDRFHPRSWWQMARETRATCFHYLGVMPAILLAIEPAEGEREHTLRFGMGGGVHPDHHGAFEARFGVPLLEGWAMTETGGAGILCAMREPRKVGHRCIGRPDRAGPPMEVRFVDDQGNAVAPGEPGELLLRAVGTDPRRRFFSGYLKDPAATDAAWAGGWFHTGDVMRQAPDGSIEFVDRKKNIIRRSGENIAAIEVESVLANLPGVRQAAVVAVLDPLRGEEVLAVIVPDTADVGDEALARAIFAGTAERLAYYKLPGYIAFVDALPTTSTQKVRKADLGQLAIAPLDHPRCFDLRDAKQSMRKPAS